MSVVLLLLLLVSDSKRYNISIGYLELYFALKYNLYLSIYILKFCTQELVIAKKLLLITLKMATEQKQCTCIEDIFDFNYYEYFVYVYWFGVLSILLFLAIRGIYFFAHRILFLKRCDVPAIMSLLKIDVFRFVLAVFQPAETST